MTGDFDGFGFGLRLGPANWRAGVGLGEQSLPSTSRVQLREALYRGLGNVVDVGVDPGNRSTNWLRLVLSGLWFPDGLGAEEGDLPTFVEELGGQFFHIGNPALQATMACPCQKKGVLQHEVEAEPRVFSEEIWGFDSGVRGDLACRWLGSGHLWEPLLAGAVVLVTGSAQDIVDGGGDCGGRTDDEVQEREVVQGTGELESLHRWPVIAHSGAERIIVTAWKRTSLEHAKTQGVGDEEGQLFACILLQ